MKIEGQNSLSQITEAIKKIGLAQWSLELFSSAQDILRLVELTSLYFKDGAFGSACIEQIGIGSLFLAQLK